MTVTENEGLPTAETKTVKRAVDVELKTITSIVRSIDALDDDAQGRVISYLWQRYMPLSGRIDKAN